MCVLVSLKKKNDTRNRINLTMNYITVLRFFIDDFPNVEEPLLGDCSVMKCSFYKKYLFNTESVLSDIKV